MNKHVFILFLSMITNAFLNSPVLAQLCGEGTFTFEIYTLNGRELEKINYEILPVNVDSMNSIFNQTHLNLYQGEMINEKYVKKIVDSSEEKELEKLLAYRDNKKKGTINDGIIKFKTIEAASHPCILHLSSNKKEIYILTNVTGGCNRVTAVLWKEYPQLVTSY